MRITSSLRRALTVSAAAATLIAGTLLAAAPASAAPPLPSRMAALGDSITQASMTCTILYVCPTYSWSTGWSSSVQSHATRLRAQGASLSAYNDAVPGATSSDLPGQATVAAAQRAQYVTIEIGANDACADSVSAMTSVADFRTNLRTALDTLQASSAQPEIFVASIPSLKRLWEVNKGNWRARLAWAIFGECDSMLMRPTSNAAADVSRRAAVQQRVDDYNGVLAAECSTTAKCRWDGGVLAAYQFSKSDISTKDYFHPSTKGQATIAALTWAKTQWVMP